MGVLGGYAIVLTLGALAANRLLTPVGGLILIGLLLVLEWLEGRRLRSRLGCGGRKGVLGWRLRPSAEAPLVS